MSEYFCGSLYVINAADVVDGGGVLAEVEVVAVVVVGAVAVALDLELPTAEELASP